ncbi:MAG: hypothetical protein NTW85_01410 [Methylococcales bacterium]|nr:hypothetical protein [Methylococcales bacterium]
MSIQLILKNDQLNDDKLQALTEDLYQTLKRETDVDVQLAKGDSEQGSKNKGDPITIGVLALVFLKSGAVVALIETLKSYLTFNSSLQIEFKNGDKVVKINAQNLKSNQIEHILISLEQLIDSEPHD